MKKQSVLSWAAFAMLIFSITSCKDSLQLDSKANFDSKVNCGGCNDIPPGGGVLASNVWNPIADFPGRKIGAVSFTLFEKLAYVGTGYNHDPVSGNLTISKDFWRYDPSNNTWTQIADFGGEARTFATAFAIGGKGYVGTGGGSTNLKDFWEYDPSTNQWTRKADFGGLARLGAAGLAIGSKGYIGTGQSTFAHEKDFWEYNPLTNLWAQKADYGGSPRVFAGGFVINNTGYLGAGLYKNVGQLDFWQYLPALNTWQQRASLGSNSNPGHSGFFAINSKGYVGGNGQLWMYDPAVNSWIQKADFPGIMYNGVGFSALGLYGYIGLGNYPSGNANFSAFYKYIPD
jgi:N-acetylneuraminic acid mutarotase